MALHALFVESTLFMHVYTCIDGSMAEAHNATGGVLATITTEGRKGLSEFELVSSPDHPSHVQLQSTTPSEY